jgi:hypothetical protein
MNRYEQTSIWQKTLGKQLEPDPFQKDRELLRVQFENFRDKAKILAAEIARDLPEFTVHDITHLDALWETAELVAKEDYVLTPAEAFVLGGTFLIHDLGMGLASFPNGINELKKEPIWNDTVASILKKKLKRPVEEKDLLKLDTETEKLATENVLRSLHAKHAEKLALVSWKNSDGNDVYLIENSELRESYGTIIGLIAHSHWWSVDELESKLPKVLGAPGIFPSNWTVDPIKIACILRVADATQIDDRRAPSFLRTIRKPSTYSDTHWNFQQKLYQPRLERSRLVFTSKSPFKINEVDSWWICNDTLKMIDNELKEVDSLLLDTNRQRLKANGVASVEDPKRLSKLITVDGWSPVDTKIKVSNVAKLVSSLGGDQLYGKNTLVPLRELIQNASDAIRARRILEKEKPEFGDITVRFDKDEYGDYIEVEDNGVGMSQKVLTGPFLDFGESFWGTSLMHEELPSLESKGFSSTGKYGIGFFSIFMWGKRANISSKRFEKGRDTTMVLEFNDGATSRPLLRKAKTGEQIKDGGTRIKVWFSSSKTLDKIFEGKKRYSKLSKPELIESLCPSIDCNIFLEEKGKSKIVIKANDWITISPLKFTKRIIGNSTFKRLNEDEKTLLTNVSKNLRLIKNKEQKVIGRGLIYKEEYISSKKEERLNFNGVVTVGGLKTSGLSGILGILTGTSHRASRDIGIPIASEEIIEQWATEQSELLSKMKLDNEIQITCASVIRACGGHTGELNIANHKTEVINYRKIKEFINANKNEQFLLISDYTVDRYEKDHNCKVNLFDNVFATVRSIPGILQTGSSENYVSWPIDNWDWFHSKSLQGIVIETISECWGIEIPEILKQSDISSDEKSYSASIGKANGENVIDDHIDIIKKSI